MEAQGDNDLCSPLLSNTETQYGFENSELMIKAIPLRLVCFLVKLRYWNSPQNVDMELKNALLPHGFVWYPSDKCQKPEAVLMLNLSSITRNQIAIWYFPQNHSIHHSSTGLTKWSLMELVPIHHVESAVLQSRSSRHSQKQKVSLMYNKNQLLWISFSLVKQWGGVEVKLRAKSVLKRFRPQMGFCRCSHPLLWLVCVCMCICFCVCVKIQSQTKVLVSDG